MHPTGAPTFAPTMDWTSFCETKNETAACAAEAGCHWLPPYSRCIPECAFGIDNRDACDTRYCSWRWTPKLPITGKCLECDAARKYETCDCGDASWGSAASRQTRGGRRNLKFGYVELNTGFVVEGSVELDGVSLADAEAHAADITSTIIDVAGGVRPADVTTCASATTTTPTCTVENQLCTTGAGTTAEKKYCCIFDEAGSGTWTAGACVPDFDDITVILSEPSSRTRSRCPRAPTPSRTSGPTRCPWRRPSTPPTRPPARAGPAPPSSSTAPRACPARSGPTSAARTGGGPRAAATCSTWPGATRSTPASPPRTTTTAPRPRTRTPSATASATRRTTSRPATTAATAARPRARARVPAAAARTRTRTTTSA